MKLPATVLFLLITLVTVLSIAANPGAAAPVGAERTAETTAEGAAKNNSSAAAVRLATKPRSRRPARIDLTMPYYRFGRLPIRIKD